MTAKTPTGRRRVNAALTNAILAIGASDFIVRATGYLRVTVDFKGVFVTELCGRKPPIHVYDNVRTERQVDVVDSYLDRSYLLDPFFNSYLKNPATRIATLDQVSPDRSKVRPISKFTTRG